MRIVSIFTAIVIPILATLASGQGIDTCWIARYNNTGYGWDWSSAVAIDHLGNTIVAGSSVDSSGIGKITVIKYSSYGDMTWVRRIDGSDSNANWPTDVAIDNANNIYISGADAYIDGSNMIVIKLLSDGSIGWIKVYERFGNRRDVASDIRVDQHGDVYVSGYIDRLSHGRVATMIKYTPEGDTVWANTFNVSDTSFEMFSDLVIDTAGNVYAVGYHKEDLNASSDYLLVKYHFTGDLAWYRTFGSPPNICTPDPSDYAIGVATDNLGYIYTTGTVGYNGNENICTDYATIKHDSMGNQIWVKYYNGLGNYPDSAVGIVVANTGYIYVAGSSTNWYDQYDIAVVKYDSEGNQRAVHLYSSGPALRTDEMAVSITSNIEGSIYVVGTEENNLSDIDIVTLKFCTDGYNEWVSKYNGPASLKDQGQDIALGDSGAIAVTGWSRNNETSADIVTIQYRQLPVSYIPGNANGDNIFNGLDIVYCVNYFKGIGPAPPYILSCPPHWPFYAAADINGNCRFDGIDVTYGVNYLKGLGPAPTYCPECPPEY